MVLLKNFINVFYVPELRKRLFFTFAVLVVYRLGYIIPVVGIDTNVLRETLAQGSGLGGFFSYVDMFSGGALSQGALFGLGILPYITASIMMQFLSMSIPALEEMMKKEGEYGRKMINQYTRYLSLGVAFAHGASYALSLERFGQGAVITPGWGFRILCVFTLMVGSCFVMWLGEQISLYGLGNGSSMIIFAGIAARFPGDVLRLFGFAYNQILGWPLVFVVLLAFIGITASIVFLEKGERKIPVQYARRVVGQKMYGGQSVYIPFKINSAGIMPVILAGAALNIPMMLVNMLSWRFEFFKGMAESFSRGGMIFLVLQFLCIVFFSFVYTAIQFNPEELADNIKKSGGFIPGIRPGKKTAEFFNYLLTRIGLFGSLYLAFLALAPDVFRMWIGVPELMSISLLSGTSLLIMVGVALEAGAQIESYLIEHHYEGFLSTGRLRSGRGQ